MIKKIGFATIALSALLLSGCGGGGSTSTDNKASTEEISKRDAIFIYKNLPSNTTCSDFGKGVTSEIQIQAKIENFISQEVDKATTCETFKKINEGGACLENDYELGSLDCVFAYDLKE